MLTAGTVFAGYRIVRLLGSGGMGEVYLAEHPRLPRHDALKVLPADVSADPEFRERFNREADLAASLWHPHIVGVHDRGEHKGQLWIALDYVDGPDAARRLRQCRPAGIPRAEAVKIVTAVAQALDHAHGRGLLHRDVKPANILLTKPTAGNRRILLADFGIGRWLDDVSGLTATNMTVGTVNYTAPEQLRGEPIDGRADQYALAATAYHLLSGAPPFQHTNPAVLISRHLTSAPPRLSDTRPELADLDEPMSRALAKDPADRYGRCADFAAALRGEARDLAPVPVAPPPVRKRRIKLGVPLAVAAAVIGVLMNLPAQPSSPVISAQPVPSATTFTSPPPLPTTTTAPPPPPPATTTTTTAPPAPRHNPGGYSWQPATGVEHTDPAIVGQGGWEHCLTTFSLAACVAAAAAVAGSPNTSGPVFPEGVYTIPNSMNYGTCAAGIGPGGSCSYRIYDSTGTVVDSGTYLIAVGKPTAEIDPRAAQGTFVASGCTPWVRIKPLPPNW